MKSRTTIRIAIAILAGVILGPVPSGSFAQTATTTSMLHAPANPANAHGSAASVVPAASTTQQAQQTQTHRIHRGGMTMHVQNWATLPTGSTNPAVKPLDPNTIPKFVNQLTRPATFVPVGTKFDRSL